MTLRDKLEERKRNRENAKAYQEVYDSALEGEVVCGTLALDGRPIYFTVPATSTNHDVQVKAFEVRNGRPMSDAESLLAEYAARGMSDEKIEDVWT